MLLCGNGSNIHLLQHRLFFLLISMLPLVFIFNTLKIPKVHNFTTIKTYHLKEVKIFFYEWRKFDINTKFDGIKNFFIGVPAVILLTTENFEDGF